MHAAVDIASEVVPPMQFQWFWVWIGIGIVLLIVLWYLLIPLIARRSIRRPAVSYAATPRPYRGPGGAAERALAAIDDVERAARAETISVREAHLRFSAIVREFAWDMTRIDARTMTLTELRSTGLTTIAAAVAQFYPIAFQEEELLELGSAADVARSAVISWS